MPVSLTQTLIFLPVQVFIRHDLVCIEALQGRHALMMHFERLMSRRGALVRDRGERARRGRDSSEDERQQ